jgi:hypothetical protein
MPIPPFTSINNHCLAPIIALNPSLSQVNNYCLSRITLSFIIQILHNGFIETKELVFLQTLPEVRSLREAVQTVIESNKKDGYSPIRFAQMMSVPDSQLVSAATKAIQSKDALNALYMAISGDHPTLLTLEDFVSVYGELWGFHPDIVELAKQRSHQLNDWSGKIRYII